MIGRINSEEFNLNELSIYEVQELDDIPQYLEEIGKDSLDIDTKYMSYEHYKHLFHYSSVMKYNIGSIFLSDYIDSGYFRYNSIIIGPNTNSDKLFDFLFNLFNSDIDRIDPICFFCDIQSKRYEHKYHTVLLSYRLQLKQLEYFDSNGISNYGHVEKLFAAINKLRNSILGFVFIDSKEINGLSEFTDAEAYKRGLNVISSISMGKSFNGWCQIWSLMIHNLIFKFPHIGTSKIVNVMRNYLKGLTISNAAIKSIYIVKGFYRILLADLNRNISKFDLHISNEILTYWYPIGVYSHKKLSEVISNEMNKRKIANYNDYI